MTIYWNAGHENDDYMRNLLPLILITSLLFSCNHPKLEEEIKQLKTENKILKDSLRKIEYNKLESSQLMLLPRTSTFKKNQKNTISGLICETQKYPEYELYMADENYKYDESDKINFQITKDNKFEFDFTPKTEKDETVCVAVVFKSDSPKVVLYARTDLPVQ